jgi:hypothetical protein
LRLSVRSQPLINGFFTIRKLAAARISWRLFRRPVVGADKRRGFVPAAHGFVVIRAAAGRHSGGESGRDQLYAAALAPVDVIVVEFFFVAEEILIQLIAVRNGKAAYGVAVKTMLIAVP